MVARADALTATAVSLDGHSVEIIDGGKDLTATAKSLDAHTASLLAVVRVFERHLPQALRALGTVESLEDSIETVAETVESLQAPRRRSAV